MNKEVKKIFDAISFKEIIVILSDIDNKILSLHECSNEDFLTFNSYLKNYSEVSDYISKNAKELYTIVAGEKNSKRYRNIEEYGNEITHIGQQLKNTSETISELFRRLMINFDNLFLPLRNFNQNLLTLKFAIANLDFNIKYYDTGSKESEKLLETSKEVIGEINNIKLFYPEVDAGLFEIKGAMHNLQKEITEIEDSGLPSVLSLIHQNDKFIRHIKNKHNDAVEKIPQLTQKTETHFDNIEKIITNLQYHDIIRQKMEHIQDTHKDIIGQLEQLDKSKNSDNIEEKIKSYIKIRDITGLQVAQLIHTNKQYQTSMSIITQKFQDISTDISIVSDLCKHFGLYTSKVRKVSYQDVYAKFSEAADIIKDFSFVFSKTLQRINQFLTMLSKWSSKLQKVSEFTKRLDKLVIDTVWNTSGFDVNQADIENTVNQVKFLASAIQRTAENVKAMHGKIKLLADELQKQTAQTITKGYDEKWHGNFIHKIETTIKDFESDSSFITKLIDKNTDRSIKFNIKIKASIEQVRYYDFFETIVEDIVDKLNELSGKLNLKVNINTDMSENLAEILRRYTTYSEYNIFAKYTGESLEHDREIDSELDDGENIDNEDDNLELF